MWWEFSSGMPGSPRTGPWLRFCVALVGNARPVSRTSGSRRVDSELVDQRLHLWRWFEAELVAHDDAVGEVLTDGLVDVALGRIDLDEDPLGAFAERVVRHDRQAYLHGPAEPPFLGKSLAQALEGMQADLPEPFPLGHEPLVVPLGQELAGSRQLGKRGCVGVDRCIEEAMDQGRQLMDVDDDPVAQPDRIGRAIDEEPARLTETPERRSQPGHGSRFGHVWPQPSGQTRSRLRPIAKREAGKHALFGPRQVEWTAIDHEIEPAQELEQTARLQRWRVLTLPFRAHLTCPGGEQ